MNPRVAFITPLLLPILLAGCAKPILPALPTDFAATLLPSASLSTLATDTPTSTMTATTAHPPTASPTYTPTRTAVATAIPWWRPAPGLTWQYQLTGEFLDDSFRVDMYDIDLFDTSADIVASLHYQERKVICYISAGTVEDWRADKDQFPKAVIGKADVGWRGERWLDIRAIDALAPVLRARLDLCSAKGFDAVEADNVDGYQNATGFPLTAADQLRFNRWLAAEAHKRGLAIALKNDPDQAAELVADFDMAISEECFDQGWCDEETVFLKANKPVLDVEYSDTKMTPSIFCSAAKKMGIQAIYKKRALDAWRQACA
jgi:hypothetical protein